MFSMAHNLSTVFLYVHESPLSDKIVLYVPWCVIMFLMATWRFELVDVVAKVHFVPT